MTEWQDDQMTRWPDDLMTRWPDGVTEWPSDRVTKWPSDQFHSKLLHFLLLLNSNIGKVALCKCSDTNIFKFQCPTWLFPSYGYPFICGNNERHWQSRYCYLVLELQLTMIIKLLQTVFTHPLKKGLDKIIYAWHLTPVFIIIYQAEHNLWCPENVGWGNFA